MPGTLKTYKARGIVLNSLKYGDSAMVVHLLTDALGRQSYMVQGVRSSRGRGSKLALFQPMFALEFEGLTSSRQQMHRFREVQSGIVLQRMPFDVRRSTIALFMAEVLYRLVKRASLTASCSISCGRVSGRWTVWKRAWPISTSGFW